MKKTNILLSIFAFLIFIVISIYFYFQKEQIPEHIKNIEKMKKGQISFSFYDTKDSSYNLNQLVGKVVLVNVWATWCLPCVDELPSLIRLAKKFPNQLIIIAVTEDSKQQIVNFFNRFETKLPTNFIVSMSDEIKKVFSPKGLPESHLFDKEGQLVSKIIGPRHWDQLEWVSKIQNLQ